MTGLLLVLASSCDLLEKKSKSAQADVRVEKIVDLPDTVKAHLIAQDSLSMGLISQIDTLTMELNNTKRQIADLQSKMDNLQSPSKIIWILCIIALLSSFMALIVVYSKSRESKKNYEYILELLKTQLGNERLPANLGVRLTKLENNAKISRQTDFHPNDTYLYKLENLEKRIGGLETRLNNSANGYSRLLEERSTDKNSSISEKNDNYPERISCNYKILYAGLNNEKYFLELTNSKQETSVYKITYSDDNKGEFELLSLDKIQSSNGWKDVVEVEANGDCTIEEAQNYSLIEKGGCEKIDDKTWKVTSSLKIRISK